MENSYLNEQLKNVINNTCNVVGCKNCDLKWDGGCMASELQDKIFDRDIQKNTVDGQKGESDAVGHY